MKQKLISKLFLPFICLCFLTSCENTELPVESFEIQNPVDGIYIVEYQEQIGFPDNGIEVKVKKSDRTIFDYRSDYNLEYLPEKITHLFEYEGGDFYYIENRTIEYDNLKSKPLCYIAYDGYNENISDIMGHDYRLQINFDAIYNMTEYTQDELNALSDLLQKNITEQEIKDIFNNCGYDSACILEIYNYKKGEKENDQT